MYNLFLDDFRMPEDAFHYTKFSVYLKEDWVIVRNYDEFVLCIKKNGLPTLVSFDHDLADIHYDNTSSIIDYDSYTEKTGYSCVLWLIDYCMDNKEQFPKYLIHSMNTVGEENIRKLINNYLKFSSR